MVENKAFMYNSVPQGWPEPGKDLSIGSTEFDTQAPPPKNGFTTRNLYATFDPSQRGRMRDASIKSYNLPMQTGQPVIAINVMGEVLRSNSDKVTPGDIVRIWMWPTESFSIVPGDTSVRFEVIKPARGVPWTAYLGVLGMTGLTAYGSLREIGQPKKGETIFVSAAAGAVGQTVGQIALREGLTVIGSVGDETKLKFITETLGFHYGFNYKEENALEALKRLAPNGIDIYFDNVGGETLDAALMHLNDFSRIIACGSISSYNNKPGEGYGLKNYPLITKKKIRWQGFIVSDPSIAKHHTEFEKDISNWIADGSFKSIDYITDGMENAMDGFLGMLKGDNLGKSLLKIADA